MFRQTNTNTTTTTDTKAPSVATDGGVSPDGGDRGRRGSQRRRVAFAVLGGMIGFDFVGHAFDLLAEATGVDYFPVSLLEFPWGSLRYDVWWTVYWGICAVLVVYLLFGVPPTDDGAVGGDE